MTDTPTPQPDLIAACDRLLAIEVEVSAMDKQPRQWFMEKPGHKDCFTVAMALKQLLERPGSTSDLSDEYGSGTVPGLINRPDVKVAGEPPKQSDLSDEGLSQLAEAIFEMDIVDAVKAVRAVRDQARMENMEQIKAARVVARLAGIQEGFDIAAPDALKESERALADAEHRLREIYKVTLQKRDNEGVWLRTIQGLAEESRRAAEEGDKDA